jgi:hypothetical protein
MKLEPEPSREKQRIESNKKYANLLDEWSIINSQIDETIDEGNHYRLKLKADRLDKEIKEVEQKLEQLDASNLNRNRRHLNFQQDLSKIDFDKARDQVNKLIRDFRKGVNRNALLIVQDSRAMAGELCITEIRELLCGETGNFKHFIFEFFYGGRLDEIGLLEGLLEHLGIAFTQNTQQAETEYIHKIIEKMCESLQGGSIIFLEIRRWNILSYQEEVLFWFVTQFWTRLITRLDAIAQTHPQVKFISMIVTDTKLSSQCLKSPALRSKENNLSILKLSLRKWKLEDIQRWLESYLGFKNPKSSQIAKSIYKSTKNGIPQEVCEELLKDFSS